MKLSELHENVVIDEARGPGLKGVFGALSVALAILMLMPATSSAWDFGPRSAYYNNQARAGVKANVFATQGYARTSGYFRDENNDGNTVYAKSMHYRRTYDGQTGAPSGWYPVANRSTGEITITSWVAYRLDWTSASYYDEVRVQARVCVQLGWPVWDRCSSSYYEVLNY